MATTTNLGITKVDSSLKQPEVPINSAFDYFDQALAGLLVKSVAGSSNVTLANSPTDEARFTRYELTGVIGANIVVFFPVPGGTPAGNSSRRFTVFNNTSGAFTLTIKTTAGGSTGVTIPQGYTQLLEHNGTNIYAVGAAFNSSGLISPGGIFIPATRVYNTSNQSIANATGVALAFNSERFDTDSIHDVVTNNSRLKCNTAGIYLIFATIAFDANVTGIRQVDFYLNGATLLAQQRINAVSDPTLGSTISLSTVYSLAINDYVQTFVYQTSGGALNVAAAGNFTPEFGMVRIG